MGPPNMLPCLQPQKVEVVGHKKSLHLRWKKSISLAANQAVRAN